MARALLTPPRMRAAGLLASVLALAMVGCASDEGTGTTSRGGETSPPRDIDAGASDPDGPPPAGTDGGAVTPGPVDAGSMATPPPGTTPYPAGPYGTSVGDVMPDLWFIEIDGSETTWEDVRSDPSVKVIVWGSGAGWCGPCRTEAPKMSDLHDRYASRGVYVIESLFEDEYRRHATPEYASEWKTGLRCNHDVVAEPDPPYGEADAIPMLWIIDAETMQIVAYANGLEPGMEARVEEALSRSTR